MRRTFVPIAVLAVLMMGTPTSDGADPAAGGGVTLGQTGVASAQASDPDCPTDVSERRPIDRVAGADRYGTAACVARAVYPTAAGGTVLLARGDDSGGWPDALAGTVLADAVGGPILLTDPLTLPPATRDEIRRLTPATVLVLGGTQAVSDRVLRAVRDAAPQARIDRVAGADRYATAAAVSERAGATGTAFVVNGHRPADALVAGAPAARVGAALLLVGTDSVPAATEAALDVVQQVVIVGGYGVVGGAAEARLADLVGRSNVRRVSGGNRAETAASLARAFPESGRIHLVSGNDRNLVDAIGAGWSAATDGGGPVLYAERERPGGPTDRYLRLGGLAPSTSSRLVGGTAVLSEALVTELEGRYAETASGGPAPQLRAMWVHLFDGALKSPASIDRVLDAAAAANLNTVIVEVARRQDAYYRSDVLPRTPDPTMPDDLDLLGRLIPAAHDRGLEVHAWTPVLPAWHPVYATYAEPLPIWRDHGKGSADPWVSVNVNGVQGEFLDPGVPAVRDLVVATYREIAERYPVDAVHLDYLRYSEDRCDYGGQTNIVGCWGYHPTALARWRSETGRAGHPAPWDAGWSDWRREQTRSLAQEIRDAVRAARPGTAVTMAGITQGEPPRTTTDYSNTKTWNGVFQAWPQWLRTGVVDAVYPMNYFDESRYPHWFDGWVAFEARLVEDCPTCDVAVGQGSWLNTPAASLDQLRQGLDAVNGSVVYSYQQNAKTQSYDALLGALPTTLFANPAPAPDPIDP